MAEQKKMFFWGGGGGGGPPLLWEFRKRIPNPGAKIIEIRPARIPLIHQISPANRIQSHRHRRRHTLANENETPARSPQNSPINW